MRQPFRSEKKIASLYETAKTRRDISVGSIVSSRLSYPTANWFKNECRSGTFFLILYAWFAQISARAIEAVNFETRLRFGLWKLTFWWCWEYSVLMIKIQGYPMESRFKTITHMPIFFYDVFPGRPFVPKDSGDKPAKPVKDGKQPVRPKPKGKSKAKGKSTKPADDVESERPPKKTKRWATLISLGWGWLHTCGPNCVTARLKCIAFPSWYWKCCDWLTCEFTRQKQSRMRTRGKQTNLLVSALVGPMALLDYHWLATPIDRFFPTI